MVLSILIIVSSISVTSCQTNSHEDLLKTIALSDEYHEFKQAFNIELSFNPRNPSVDYQGIMDLVEAHPDHDDITTIDKKLYLEIKGGLEFLENTIRLHQAEDKLERKYKWSKLTRDQYDRVREIYNNRHN